MTQLKNSTRRSGVASMWALTVLSIVGLISAGVMREIVLSRYASEMRGNRLRTERLARSGLELAIDKILDDEKYQGEKAHLANGEEVCIVVVKTDTGLRIEVEAKFSVEGKPYAHSKLVRDVVRTVKDGLVEVKMQEDPR